jgi:hypothetical protein
VKLGRLTCDPALLLDFYEAGLAALGAVCARPWHDRLELLAEGRAARLWNPTGELHEGDLRFVAPDAGGPRDAAREVFPGCPLTFKLAEALKASPLPLERVVLAAGDRGAGSAPAHDVAERLWRAQFPDTARWCLATPFARDHHFSVVALARCEIQAIDQQWALCRVAVDLSNGTSDGSLADAFGAAAADPAPVAGIDWPVPAPAAWSAWLCDALARDLAPDLAAIRERQQNRLRHEWERIDNYFESYTRELTGRSRRGTAMAKLTERLAAAPAEQARHRADQAARHEIAVHPHLDALVVVAEPVWRARLEVVRDRRVQQVTARFIPRARRWSVLREP